MGWRRRRGIGGRRERVVTFLLAPAPSCPGPPVATAERGTGSRQDCASVTRRAAGSGSAHAVGLYLALITGEGGLGHTGRAVCKAWAGTAHTRHPDAAGRPAVHHRQEDSLSQWCWAGRFSVGLLPGEEGGRSEGGLVVTRLPCSRGLWEPVVSEPESECERPIFGQFVFVPAAASG